MLVSEPGLRAFIRAYHFHQAKFIDDFSLSLVAFGSENYVELFSL